MNSWEGIQISFTKTYTLTEDDTCKNVKNLINSKNIVTLKGDKNSSIVILDTKDYIVKLKNIIQDSISKGTYEIKQEDTLQNVKCFQDFLRRNVNDYEHYKEMYPKSNQPARTYSTAKTQKFNNINEMNLNLD